MNQETNENLYLALVIPQLKKLLLEIPSEKPDRVLNSTDGPSKWRKGWFATVIGNIDMLGIDFFKSDAELQKRIDDARDSWTKGEMRQRDLTQQSDIDQADQLIRDVSAFLEKPKEE